MGSPETHFGGDSGVGFFFFVVLRWAQMHTESNVHGLLLYLKVGFGSRAGYTINPGSRRKGER